MPAVPRTAAHMRSPIAIPPAAGGVRRPMPAAMPTATLPAAMTENVTDQPAACSSAATGIALANCPAWPMRPVVWTSIGTRRGGNHSAISRLAPMKIGASPAPMSTRAISARGTSCVKASSV